MKRSPSRIALAGSTSLLLAVSLAACAPGGGGGADAGTVNPTDISTDPSEAGDITLTVWDGETSPGINATLEALNAEFEELYPNVTIERVVRSLDDLKATLRLAMSDANPPDVVEANQGYSDMAAYVDADLLTNLGVYADAYGWEDRFPESQLALNSVTEDGGLGGGDLYGVSLTGEIVGVFVNEDLLASLGQSVPTTQDAFEEQLPAIAAAGTTPIQFGNSDTWPAIHLWGSILAGALGAEATSDLIFGRSGSWTDPTVVEAATELQEWAQNGYIPAGYDGQSIDASAEAFAAGESPYFIGGIWNQSIFADMANVSFHVLPESDGSSLVALGGIGYPWAIPSRSENQDVAAAYIDFITSPEVMAMLVENEQLPSVLPEDTVIDEASLGGDVQTTWNAINADEGLVPYLDWATPTFYDTITENLQLLMAGQSTPEQFTEALEADYSAFLADR